MSGWTLVLTVLGLGLAGGAFLVWRLRGAGSGEASGEERAGELADLERRREALYARLRGEALEEDERIEVELEAARTLEAVERLRAELPEARPAPCARVPGAKAPAVSIPETAGTSRMRAGGASAAPARAGRTVAAFLAGAAASLLLTWLVLGAQRDARPREEAPAGPVATDHPEGPELSAEDRARLEALRARLEAQPADLGARKQYALALLGTGQFFAAFNESQEILGQVPGDPDGLYIQGMVRLQMGQDEGAVELFDGVLRQYPQHVLALTGKGVALYRAGDAPAARTVWQQALAASGGGNPQVEHLLRLLEERAAVAGEPPVGAPAGEMAAGGVAGVSEGGAPGGGADSFRLRVRLAASASPPPGAVLFVFLRGEAPGPPAAVKRVAAPEFPLELELTAADSMLGRPLPARGTLAVRLDADGNASTRGDADLAAEAPAAAGALAELELGG